MKHAWLPTAASAILAIAGCVSMEQDDIASPGAEDACGAGAARFLVGERADATTLARAREATGARSIRVIGPDTIVTQDFAPGRLNLETDAEDRIVRLRCG